MKVLLVNAQDEEEIRIALLEDGRVEEIYVEAAAERSATGNIYRGRVQNVEKGIGAAFVDLGRGLTGFLHVSDMPDRPEGANVTEVLESGQEVLVQITRDSIGRKGPALTGRVSLPGRYLVLMPNTPRSGVSRRIARGKVRERAKKMLKALHVPEGMGVIVRTAGEEATVSLMQRDLDHLVAIWEQIREEAGTASQPAVLRRESDPAERSIRDILPPDATRIVVDRVELAERMRSLLETWYGPDVEPEPAEAEGPAGGDGAQGTGDAEATAADTGDGADDEAARPDEPEEATRPSGAEAAPEGDDEALVPDDGDADDGDADDGDADDAGEDDDETFDEAASRAEDEIDDGADDDEPEVDGVEESPPHVYVVPEVIVHEGPMPLFHAYDVEQQLEEAFRRSLRLESGGSIVIDPTEALVAIDVNSGRFTDEEDPESTALQTNLEAAAEVARQLRLRDLGGLIVLDFIDMRDRKAVRKVEQALRDALARDRARIRLGRIGPFGCVILSRQRIRQALTRVTHEECTTCGGTGRRRHPAGLGLRVLREMQARAARSQGRGGLEVRVPHAVREWIRRHRRHLLKDIERVCSGPVRLEADDRLGVDGWAMKGLPPISREEGE